MIDRRALSKVQALRFEQRGDDGEVRTEDARAVFQ